MKKCLFLISFIFLFFTLSCNNEAEQKLTFLEEDTIKKSVKTKESNITWSKEIEGERLSQDLSPVNSKVSSEVEYNMDVMKVLPDFQKPQYPEFENFGKLDISELNYSAKEKIVQFCTDFSKGSNSSVQSYFNNQYIFNYVFFMDEIKKDWITEFGEEYPEKMEEEQVLFDKWILGQPFMGEEIIQIPVRFYCKQGTLDITLYLNSKKQYSIYQITINRWEKV